MLYWDLGDVAADIIAFLIQAIGIGGGQYHNPDVGIIASDKLDACRHIAGEGFDVSEILVAIHGAACQIIVRVVHKRNDIDFVEIYGCQCFKDFGCLGRAVFTQSFYRSLIRVLDAFCCGQKG